jgi:hypothetical protein
MAAVVASPDNAEICGCNGVCRSKITGKGSVRTIPLKREDERLSLALDALAKLVA